jgi:tripartite-type tricarboxylate transporter receptor subunit TctC
MNPVSASHRVIAIAACAITCASVTAACAEYPDHPVKLVVPYSPGGPADLFGRYVAVKLTAVLGQTFVIENKPGAGLVIGAQYAAASAPDGYTLFLAASSMLVPSSSRVRTTADNLKDFGCISLIGSLPLVLIANPSLPVRNVRELIEFVRKRPNDVNYGSSGNGSLTHLAGELFQQMTDVKMVHIPYRGINEALTDLIAGRAHLSFAGAPIALPHAKTGKVRALAVTSMARAASAPELPTIAESGLPGYDVTPWYGLVVPAAAPAPVIKKLHQDIVRVMQLADVKERWIGWGADPTYSKSPDEFAALMRSEAAKWAKLIGQGTIKLE